MTVPRSLTLAQARRVWRAHQRLDGTRHSINQAIEPLSWVPVPVIATALLALRARGMLSRRAELETKLFTERTLEITPGPRGHLWLVPTDEGPWARAFAVADHASREGRIAAACGLTSGDLRSTRDALRSALETPVTPSHLREKLPASSLRPLGEPGRRAGCNTLAGMVLRSMWAHGEVLREPVVPQLDPTVTQQFFLDPRPRVVPTAADAVDHVAPLWLAAHGPTTLRALSLAFGIAAGRAELSLRGLDLEPVAIESLPGDYLSLAGFDIPPVPDAPNIDFLPFCDPLIEAAPNLTGLVSPDSLRELRLRDLGFRPLVLSNGAVIASWSLSPTSDITLSYLNTPQFSHSLSSAIASLSHFITTELPAPRLHTTTLPRKLPPLYGSLGADL